ncbi:MAG: anthranilate synthase component I family protein, partial [Candidatus Krumholzibacteria bacterium]|nr:anthranilate synthase component I family protein [Candidatus Krumholzibacteria bacterium]
MSRSQITPLKLALPFWRYGGIFGPGSHAFLLDSAMDPDHLGRYSFLGGNPSALLTAHRVSSPELSMALTLTTWRKPDGARLDSPLVREWTGDPFIALRGLQRDYHGEISKKRPPGGPFQSGLVGYFGYETGYAIETLPDTGEDDLQLPDLAFMVVDEVLCHDHSTKETTLSIVDRGDADSVLQDWRERLATFETDADVRSTGCHTPDSPPVRAHFTKEQYCTAVQKCRDHIFAGDVFEVCLTHRLEMDLPGPPWDLYGILRDINPAPFAAWLRFPGFQVVSASPERFLRLDSDRIAESRPIKGTRPRGDDPTEDKQLRDDLANSTKDRAENVMIVDLVRNDLGRVAEIGSVEV